MDLELAAIAGFTTIVVSGGAAWGAAKQALNGTRERVRVLETDSKAHADAIARVETKVDILIDRRV